MTRVLTVRSSWPGRWTRTRSRRGNPMLLGVALLGVGLAGVAGGSSLVARGIIGALGLVILAIVALSSVEVALPTLVGWLAMLGFIRRLLIPFAGWSPYDPLLLISPIGAVLLLLGLRGAAPARNRTLLSSLALFLLLWTIAEVLNPVQSNVLVAAQGAMFVVTPLLWFFVGRRLTTPQHDLVLLTVLVMNIPIVIEGLYHTFVGFLPFELHWIGISGQSTAIFLPGFRIRPFSTLTSPQEYGIALSIGAIVITARLLNKERRRVWLLVLYGATVVALFLQGSRSIFLAFVAASAVQVVAHYRTVAAVAGVVAAVGALAFGLLVLAPAQTPVTNVSPVASPATSQQQRPSSASSLVDRQLSGLQHPDQSTASTHITMIKQSLQTAVDHPLGLGSATGTIASAKAGVSGQTPVSADVGDVAATAQSMGILAAVVVGCIIIVGFGGAFRLQRLAPSTRHVTWVGILAASLDQWFNGGLYYTSSLGMLALGGIASEVAAYIAARKQPIPVQRQPDVSASIEEAA